MADLDSSDLEWSNLMRSSSTSGSRLGESSSSSPSSSELLTTSMLDADAYGPWRERVVDSSSHVAPVAAAPHPVATTSTTTMSRHSFDSSLPFWARNFIYVPVVQFVAGIRAAVRPDRMLDLLSVSNTSKTSLKNTLQLHGAITCGSLLSWQFIIFPLLNWLLSSSILPGDDSNIQDHWGTGYMRRAILSFCSLVFYLTWVAPEFVVALVENGPWLNAISCRAHLLFVLRRRKVTERDVLAVEQLQRHRTQQQQQPMRHHRSRRRKDTGIGLLPKVWAEAIYASTFVLMLILLQTAVGKILPGVLGFVGSQLVLSWAYALICFEYRWPDWHLDARFRYVEANWSYFSGFGIAVAAPVAFAEWVGGFFLSYGVWYLMFPFFVVNAIGASQPPFDRDTPSGRIFRLPVFTLSKHLNSALLRSIVWVIEDGLPLLYRVLIWFRKGPAVKQA